MFPQFGATAETLSKASTMVFRIGTDAHLYDDPDDVSIAPLLDSKFDSEKREALKRLLALIAQGLDVSAFFPQVVKNVASQSLEVKKLVYLYLLHYAEKRPNEALLSINYFQKDLGDPNPLVRAWALRTMAGIRLHVIAPIVLVAVGKCARDPSVYVRKCVANALPKLHDLRLDENTPSIQEIVGILLNDHSPGVVGAAAAAFASVCPNNLSLIGKNFQRLCEILPDMEEWGQIILTGILLRYAVARHGLVRESVIFALRHEENGYSGENVSESMGWNCESKLAPMISQPDEYLHRFTSMNKDSSESKEDYYYTSGRTNEDVKILLKCTSPLLWSQNSAVLLAAAGIHWILAPMEDVKQIVKPLLFVLRSSNASKYVVLCNIQVFAKAMPSLFGPYFEDFFVCSSDSYHIRVLKLDILSSIATETSISLIFKEFQDYIKDPDRRFAGDTIAAMGICVERLPKTSNTCLECLLALVRQEFFSSDFASNDGEAGILIQAILSIKSIIRPDPLSHEKVIVQLVRSLDSIKIPPARGTIIWMIGEYNSLGELIPRMLTTTLKYLAWCFPSEALEPKLQILNTTVKVLLCDNGQDKQTTKKVLSYLFELAKSDMNYNVRDRACFLEKLVSSCLNSEESVSRIIAKSLFGGQTVAVPPETKSQRIYLPGSLSLIVLHSAPGYEPLPKPYSLIPEMSASEDQDTSGSDDEETASQNSSGSSGETEKDDEVNPPLIQLSESADFEQILSKRAFESWLDEQPSLSSVTTSEPSLVHGSSARISIGNITGKIKRKSYGLLAPVNGNGLKVDYSFLPDISTISPLLVCLEASFCNCSTVPLTCITLTDEESSKASDIADQASTINESSRDEVPSFVSMDEITSLEPDQAIARSLQVRFNHHLLPVKLVLRCNGTTYPVKLWPDIGYFIKALPMDIQDFIDRESQLKGMFEYTRSCSFSEHIGEKGDSSAAADKFLEICTSLALKMLSNANLFLVSVDLPVASDFDDASGLCLRFSSDVLSSSKPCLITVTVQGKCHEPLTVTVKVNCEETVFGLNLLNRVVNFLVEPSRTQ